MKIFGFVGLGLMGGSLAKAVKNCAVAAAPFIDGGIQIFACDKDSSVLEQARTEGVITEGFSVDAVDKMLEQCDVVFICLYPKLTLDFLLLHQSAFKSGAVITDIAGVKMLFAKGLVDFTRTDIDFVPAHPMAGSEKEGYAHSSPDIFKGRNYLFMPLENTKPESLVFLENLAYAIGFKRVIRTDAKSHDHKIAFTSQLCHLIASALVDSAEDTNITTFGGGSYEDLTRIAMINSPLWTELFMENKDELLQHIDLFENSLVRLKTFLQNSDSESMQDALQEVRTKRIAMSTLK